MAARTPCLRRCSTISTTSPSQQGVEGTDSEEVWILTEESAILVMSTSLLGKICLLPYKGGTFYAHSLQATSRCAIRGLCKQEPTATPYALWRWRRCTPVKHTTWPHAEPSTPTRGRCMQPWPTGIILTSIAPTR